jgi:hypothetical protein
MGNDYDNIKRLYIQLYVYMTIYIYIYIQCMVRVKVDIAHVRAKGVRRGP